MIMSALGVLGVGTFFSVIEFLKMKKSDGEDEIKVKKQAKLFNGDKGMVHSINESGMSLKKGSDSVSIGKKSKKSRKSKKSKLRKKKKGKKKSKKSVDSKEVSINGIQIEEKNQDFGIVNQ